MNMSKKSGKGRWISKVLFVFVCLLGFLEAFTIERGAIAAVQAEFYVSPVGNDSNIGTYNQPFATMERARQAVRTLNASMTGDIHVIFRGGIYPFAATVQLDRYDSGSNGYNVIYRSYPGEQPIFTGGDAIAGTWTSDTGNIMKLNIGTGKEFRQLYVDGLKSVRSRKPNAGSSYTLPTDMMNDGFNLTQGVLSGVTNMQDRVEMAISIEWMHKRVRIHDAYDTGGYTRAVINLVEWDDINHQPQGNINYNGRSYWLENAYEFIDQAGEWHYNNATGYLYYWPRSGEVLSTAEIIVPRLDTLIQLNGTPDDPVSHLVFDGLELRYTNWARPNSYGFVDVQSNTLIPSPPNDNTDQQYRHNQKKDRIPAAFQAYSSQRIRVTNSVFTHLGGTGVTFDNGGSDNTIDNNRFTWISGSGLEIGNDNQLPNDDRLWPRRYVVFNNRISHIGTDYYGSVGIAVFYIDTLDLQHNEISDVPYSGISVGWGWGNNIAGITKDVTIKYNKVVNYMKEVRDGGGIYTTNSQARSAVSNNYVLNANNDYAGLYHDELGSGFTTEKNVVENAPRWTHLWKSSIHDITLDHNYTTTPNLTNNGTNITISNLHVHTDANWPVEARGIISGAGYIAGAQPPIATTPPVPLTIVIDNGQIGYSEYGTWAASGLTGYNGTGTRYGSSSGAYAKWAPDLSAGYYRVSIFKVADTNSDNQSLIDIHFSGNTQTKNVDYSSGVSGWVVLGTYYFAAGNDGYVKITKNSSNFVRADAIRFEKMDPALGTVNLIDNGQIGYSENGTWASSGLAGYNGTGTRFGSSSGAYAQWNPNISATGTYNVFIYKVVNATSDTNAKIDIVYDGGTATKYIDYTSGTSGWVYLGAYPFTTGTSQYVRNTRNSAGYIRADAVKFEK